MDENNIIGLDQQVLSFNGYRFRLVHWMENNEGERWAVLPLNRVNPARLPVTYGSTRDRALDAFAIAVDNAIAAQEPEKG